MMICAMFGWNTFSNILEDAENVKNFTDKQTDKRRTTGYQKSSLMLKAQVS